MPYSLQDIKMFLLAKAPIVH